MDKITQLITQFIDKHFGQVDKSTSVSVIEPDVEEMVSYDVVYEPNTLDAHGEWMSEETIQKGCENFEANRLAGNIASNLFHMEDTDLYTIEKSWIVPELDMIVEATGEKVKAGTWVAKVKYHDPDLWTLRKAGVITGLSMQCEGVVNKETGEITDLSFGEAS